jgi:hypothetical protein
MAPELISHQGWDRRIDIYSIGCMAIALLTGKPPFEGTVMELCQAHINKKPPRLSERVSGLPSELDDLIQACLQKDPSRRIQRASIVARSLRELARGPIPSGVPQRDVEVDDMRTLRTRRVRSSEDQPAAIRSIAVEQPLADLIGVILEHGGNDPRLFSSFATLRDCDSDVHRRAADLDEMTRRRESLDRHFREREAALLFALGEVRQKLAEHVLDPMHASPDGALGSLEVRLTLLRRLAEREMALVTRAENQAASALAEARETHWAQQCVLLRIVADLVPLYLGLEPVNRLWQAVRAQPAYADLTLR